MITKGRYNKIEEIYHSSRPSPPKILLDLVRQIANKEELKLVVDLGCGTGISTNFWSDISQRVIGLDISEEMIEFARRRNENQKNNNVEFAIASSSNTGLGINTVDLIYVSQAIHWMSPQETAEEIIKVLKSKGIFLVLNCNLNPLFDVSIEDEFMNLWRNINKIRNDLNIENESLKWTINQHYKEFQKLKEIKYIRKVKFCSQECGNINRLLDLINSIGMVNVLRKKGVSDKEMGIEKFKQKIAKHRDKMFSMYFFFEGFIAQK